METGFQFNVNENTKGQRILLIDDDYHVFEHHTIKYSDFDGIMFLSENGNLVEQQFLHLSPVTEKEFYLKPFFVNPNLINAPFLKCAADGLSIDINDSVVMDKIGEIELRIERLNIEVKGEELKKDEKTILISLFRFFLSRGSIPDPILKEGSTLGYCVCFYEFYMKYRLFSLQSILLIYEEYFQSKYIKHIDVIDVVQYCKYCNHTHIIFTEICPKCHSCQIEVKSMIHHFLCANITPESSYMANRELICPKCKKNLHHIGVDYDRPTGVYSCDSCNISFSRSNMKGTCVSCKKVSTLAELRLLKIYSLEFTAMGREKFSHWSIYKSNEDMAISTGFLSINAFTEYLTNEIQIYNLSENDNNLTTIRIQGIQLSEAKLMAQFIFDNIINVKCTFKDDSIYISLQYDDENVIEDYAKLLDNEARRLELKEYIGVNYTDYTSMIATNDYLKQVL